MSPFGRFLFPAGGVAPPASPTGPPLSGRGIIMCLRRSARQRAQCGPTGRQGPAGPSAAKRHLPPTAARPRPQAGTPCRPTVRRERGRRAHLSGTSSYPMAPQAAPTIRHTKVGDRGYGLLSGSRCTAPGTKRLPGFPRQRPEPLAASPQAPFGYFPAQSESNPPPGRRNDD